MNEGCTLRELLEAKIHSNYELIVANRLLTQTKIDSIERGMEISRLSMEKRLEAMNEFRGQMADQSKLFLPRLEYHPSHEALEKRIGGLEKLVWGLTGGIAILELILRFLPVKPV